VVAGRDLGTGEGRTKKEAEQRAAELAWRTLTAEAAAGSEHATS
jgi:ribonuclease III